jgi:hypothetical protein
MKSNVGKIDKVIRVVLSVAFFSSYFILEGNLRYIAVVGIVPLVTGMISFCPLYKLINVKTN